MAESILNQVSSQPPPTPAAVSLRSFGDTPRLRAAIFDNALSAARAIPPVTNSQHVMSVHDVDYEGPSDFSIADQKRALLERGTLTRPLRGTVRLSNRAGDVLAEKRTTLARVPYLTQRGNFILNGTAYTLANQMRLLPGIYTRQQDNGEVEAHANVMPGRGVSHHYSMDPNTGVFKLHLLQSSLPLLPVARAIGLKDSELRKHWGEEIFQKNNQASDNRAIDKLLAKLVKPGEIIDQASKEKRLAEIFSKMEFDPEVNQRTLGRPFKSLDRDAMVEITKKLLAVNRGQADTDDRDHLANQRLLGPEDLISERLKRSATAMNQTLWKVSNRGNLDSLPTNFLGKHVMSAITDSGLGQVAEEINPSEIFDHQFRVSRLGVGGISDVSAVPAESRNVHPSQLAFIDLLKTPESFRAGVDMRASHAIKKGSDGRIYAEFTSARTGQKRWVSPQDLAGKVISFPGELESGESYVPAVVGSRIRTVPRDQVDYVAPHAENWWSPVTNLTLAKSMDKAQRVAMGSRFATQALPLEQPEAPLVQTAIPGQPGRSFVQKYGRPMGAVHADDDAGDGEVTKVEPTSIQVRHANGEVKNYELYHNFPYNQKTLIHNTPVVSKGDKIKSGQLLAKSNYTDDQGHFAIGKNFRTAYTSFGGLNYEDAWVISESAAKRLSSQNLYQHELPKEDGLKLGKKHFVSIYGSTFNRDQLGKLDDDGVIKPGMVVQPGDPLVAAVAERPATHKSVFSGHKGSWSDKSITWEQNAPGEVTDVAKTDDGIVVAVKAVKAATVGDKLAGAHGDKGVIAKIVPDDQMPRNPETKEPYEILANPLGLISRQNAGQKVEAWLGKLAAKTGKPELLEDFSGNPDLVAWVEQRLQQHGLTGDEPVEDPSTGRKVNVSTGMRYFMKLHHTAAGKHQGRGLGAYTADDAPAKGGVEGAKKTALMNVNAYLSHNALGVLRDIGLIRGQKNHEYWSTSMSGYKPATPPVPKVYRKFIDYLRAGGVNVQRQGSQLHLMALTDQDVDKLAETRELQNADTVDWNSGYKPVPGGLFDTTLTGGHGGNKWSAIKLHEPLPNPVMEDPIRHLLGLTVKEFEATLAGEKTLGGETGPQAIGHALASINVQNEIANCRKDIVGTRKGARDIAIRKLGYLKACERTGVHPKDWMLSRVPVLPPQFRAVSQMAGGSQLVADPNYLYKELFDANNALTTLSSKVDDVSDERRNLYHAFKGVVGLGDPTRPKNVERGVKGLLAHVFGDGPKYSVVQQKLIGKTTDLVGRAVITPNPDLSMDEIGIPEKRAWEVYAPSIIRRLVRDGMSRTDAMLAVKNRSHNAAKAMLAEMDERPVIANRAPVLHKFGQMAFFPRLVKGDTLQISPLVVGGFNADFDGDAMNYEVAADSDAAKEALYKMLPSRNLISEADFKKPMHRPRQEYVGGLHSLTSQVDEDRPVKKMPTPQDVIRAWHRGDLEHSQRITL